MKKILIVDDIIDNIKVAMNFLKNDNYELFYATSGKEAIERVQTIQPDLVLMDVMMPEMSGFETVKILKDEMKLKNLLIIFLTAKTDPHDIEEGFKVGGVDYITKPFSNIELNARVKNHLELDEYRTSLELAVTQRTKEIYKLKDIVIEAMGDVAEYRDPETGGHIKRTQNYVRVIAQYLQTHSQKFGHLIDDEFIDLLYKSSPLHDIGKVGIPDNILLKPGKLDEQEFEEMKKHTQFGFNIISKLETQAGPIKFLELAKEIAIGHHENYDGTGYPYGLKEDEIPLSAKIMAVADVYDALICKRVYKKPITHEETIDIMNELKGKKFDPEIYEAFRILEEEIIEIKNLHQDDE